MLKSYKYRIYPNFAQKAKIDHTIEVCRLVYNLALEVKMRAWEVGVKIHAFDLCRQLIDLKKAYLWIAEADSQALQAAVKRVDVSFKNFFTGSGYPRFKSKKSGAQSFQCPNETRRIDFKNKLLTIPKIVSIPIAISRTFEGKIKTITISRTPTGKYYASILVENDLSIPAKREIAPDKTVGLDVGLKSFVITSNGEVFKPNRYLKQSLSRLKILQRRASKKQKGGANRKRAALSVAKLHEKITNQRIDYIHKTTSKLISDSQADTFVVEELPIVNMLKNRKLSQSISDVSWGKFFEVLQYKCDWHGKNLIRIGRFDPSSKRCSVCGHIKESLTLLEREWTCSKCSAVHDRDLNAAQNIRWYGLEQNAGVGSPDEPVERRRLRRAKKQESAYNLGAVAKSIENETPG